MSVFSLPFMREALAASFLTGSALSLIGVLILARRISFSGLAASQLAALGTAVFAAADWHAGGHGAALLLAAAGLALLPVLARSRRLPGEAWVACLYVLGAGLAVLVLSKSPAGEAHSMTLFFGNLLSVGRSETIEAGILLAVVAGALATWLHRWAWVVFDPISAQVAGLRADRWGMALAALLALAMTVAIHVLGVLLAFAYLILPAAIALLWTRSLVWPFLAAPLVAGTATVAGCWASVAWDLPTGPLIAALLAGSALVLGAWRLGT